MAFSYFKGSIIPPDQVVYVYDLVKNIIAPGDRAFMSPTIEKVVDSILDERLKEGWRTDPKFIAQLNKSFRAKNFSTYDIDHFPDYYAAYYLPNNLYKIQLMFLELFRLGKISFSEKKISVLDLGAAVGTTAWAIHDLFEILYHVLELYGMEPEKLPEIQIGSIEQSQGNIEFFKLINNSMAEFSTKVKVNDPIQGDVLNGALDELKLSKYDVIVASNMINEFPSYSDQLKFAEHITNGMKKTASFILLETAYMKDSIGLKQIQESLTTQSGIQVLSPCGKIGDSTDRCKSCYSFRRESLKIPKTMKLFHEHIDTDDENEKLKWSYSIFVKQDVAKHERQSENILGEIEDELLNEMVTVDVEIVSGRLYDKRYPDFYFIKICDQSEDQEQVILQIPRYFELPKHHFGDVFTISNARVQEIEWSKPASVKYAIVIDSVFTEVKNHSELSEQRSLVRFENIKEDNILYFLNRFFGFSKFNDGQFEILKKVLSNENVLGILATGGGKSIAFQLPALLKPGVSIIVSPLKSLMNDQVFGLKHRFGFDFVDCIHSGMEIAQKRHVMDRFRKGHLKILYVAPERLQQKTFQKELTNLINKGININYFPVDEAHCISEWGHDFRPAYAKLKERQMGLPHVNGDYPPIIALTATASSTVQDDVLNQLGMNPDSDLVHRIIDRRELSLEVIKLVYLPTSNSYRIQYRDPDEPFAFIDKEYASGEMKHQILVSVLKDILPLRFDDFDLNKDSGLIFTIYADPKPAENEREFISDKSREREGARWVSEYMQKNGVECQPWFSTPGYRPGIKAEESREKQKRWEKVKVKTQDDFIADKINLLATTKGFGMGIDKPNIRYIVHYGFPGSLEEYFQQIGRAGRDRDHSHCILLWDAPMDRCADHLNQLNSQRKIPKCFELDETSDKVEYTECPYGRVNKCDYAKQVFFIEGGYPSVQELDAALTYIKQKTEEGGATPWVYLKMKYIKEAVARTLDYQGRDEALLNENLIVETLFTLKYLADFSQTYLKIDVRRTATLKQIMDSTNSEIIGEHIELLEQIYPGILDMEPTGEFTTFDIADYVYKLRVKTGNEIQIDEVVEFFNLLGEREDVDIQTRYYQTYGYEIKLNMDMINKDIRQSEHLKKVNDWKYSQYTMLDNLVKYAELQPYLGNDDINDEESKPQCRRSEIMMVFGTGGATDTVRCNFCDNCGYHNPWSMQANDIIAGESEQNFIKDLRHIFLAQSKNSEFVKGNFDQLASVATRIKENGYEGIASTISNSWFEQIGQSENMAALFIVAISEYLEGDTSKYQNHIQQYFEQIDMEIKLNQNSLLLLATLCGIDPLNLYESIIKDQYLGREKMLIEIYDSKTNDRFEVSEMLAGIVLTNTILSKYDRALNRYERLEA